MSRKKTNFIATFFTTVTVFVVFLNSGYYRTTITASYIPLALLIAITAVYLFLPADRAHAFRFNPYLFIILAGIGVSLLFNLYIENLLSGGRVAVTLLCAYVIVTKINFRSFMHGYNLVVSVIILISAALYIFLKLELPLSLPMIIGENALYYDLLFVTQEIGVARSCGIFWEPGVLASIIVIALIFEIYFKERTSFFYLLVYMAGIYLTKSAAGFLILLLLLFGYVWKKTLLSRFKIANSLFIAVLLIAILFYKDFFYWLNTLNPEVFGKLVESQSATTATRINTPAINFNIFLAKPLFGWGFTGAASLFKTKLLSSVFDARIVAQTSTSTQLLAAIGIAGAAYSIGFASPLWTRKFDGILFFVDKFTIIVCLLLMVNKEPHIYFVITWIVLFYLSTPCASKNPHHRSLFIRGARKKEEDKDYDVFENKR